MIERVVTSGIFSLDGEDFEVDNNIWIVGDDTEVVVIDAAHDHRPIVEAVGGRRTVAIVATHGHNDHINAAAALAEALDAPVWLHPDDRMLWHAVYPDRPPDGVLADGMTVAAGGTTLSVLHTPGHSPGGCCLYDEAGACCSPATPCSTAGPGPPDAAISDFPTIIDSIRDRLLVLPWSTRVLTGHGDETTIGAEAPHLPDWIRDHP